MIMKNIRKTIGLICLTAFALGLNAKAADPSTDLKPYPITKCIVTGEKLGGMGKPYIFTHEGREIKLCCQGCLKEFKKSTETYLKKLDAAEKECVQKNPYKLDKCLVTGEKRGSMGKPVSFVYEDREIKLCCKGCLKTFVKNPDKYMKQLAQAK